MTDEYIKKADAYRIAVHGTDPDVAYKIQQLHPENVIVVQFDWKKLGEEMYMVLTDAEKKMKEEMYETSRLLTGAEKCDKVEVEE